MPHHTLFKNFPTMEIMLTTLTLQLFQWIAASSDTETLDFMISSTAESDENWLEDDNIIIIGGGGGGFVLFVAIITVCCCSQYRRKREAILREKSRQEARESMYGDVIADTIYIDEFECDETTRFNVATGDLAVDVTVVDDGEDSVD